MTANVLLTASLIALATISPTTLQENDQVLPASIVYEDYDDTTSFNDAKEITHQSNLTNTQVFGESDRYDYIKYTAPYTRHFYLYVTPNNGARATIEVFLQSKSLTVPVKRYSSASALTVGCTTFIEQGDTVYFRIRCTANCVFQSDLILNYNPTGTNYVNYEKFHNYNMPHTGSATIYYDYDDSCEQLVSGQTFTYADALDEAIRIWEGVGQVDFVQNSLLSTFKVEVLNNAAGVQVTQEQNYISPNYFIGDFVMTALISHYNTIIYGKTNDDGTECTIWQAVLSEAVVGFGFVLGIELSTSNFNMVSGFYNPYVQLGDGDIASFIALWGDAND